MVGANAQGTNKATRWLSADAHARSSGEEVIVITFKGGVSMEEMGQDQRGIPDNGACDA